MEVVLKNVSDRELGGPDDPDCEDDHTQVIAWIRAPGREPLPAKTDFVFSFSGFPHLHPGEAVRLPVSAIATLNVDQLPAADYEIEAMLTSLNLRTPRSSYRVLT